MTDMARLTTTQRKRLPKSSYALPSKVKKGPTGAKKTRGAYPINDKAHARNALSRVAQHGTPAQKKTVKAKVCKKYPSIRSCKKGRK